MSVRLSLAAQAHVWPDGPIVMFGPSASMDLSVFDGVEVVIVQDHKPDAAEFERRGYQVVTEPPARDFAAAIVFLPRSKSDARDQVASAARVANKVFVDGQKTDGVDSMLKQIKARVSRVDTISKAHGKLFWFEADHDFSDWQAAPTRIAGQWHVRAGVFSADGIDPGSALLVEHLPGLKGHVADLGAGWGYLSATLLKGNSEIQTLHLVEAQKRALDCARLNVDAPVAHYHWADATAWTPETPLDAVVMNPPFHTGRSADPGLGRAFIAAAARALKPKGRLFLVANRHLPYEATLEEHFSNVSTFGGDNRYKLLCATGVSRHRA